MKHIKHLLTALLLFCCTVANAYDFEVDGIYYNILSEEDKTIEVMSGDDDYNGDITIPESVTYNDATYSVTAIGQWAFTQCDGLTSIEIPNSVTTIGDYAFYRCNGLRSVVIPNSVTTIGEGAFYCCTSLTSIEIPNSVTTIEHQAFWCCVDLTSITVDENNPVYDSRNNCNAIIETASNTLLSGCQNTIIPNSVTTIGDDAFSWCTGFTSITIPSSVTTIGNYAFSYCSGLTSIEIPNSVTTIGNGAFEYCTNLTSIEIPNSVTTIGDYTFYRCSNLRRVTIPNSVTTIGYYAFYDCDNLKTVINLSNLSISKGSKENGYVAYYADKVLNYQGCELIGDFLFRDEDNTHKLVEYIGSDTDIVLPDSYKGETYIIGANAFEDYTNLKSVTIPDAVTAIGDQAFYNCSALKSITIGSGVTTIGECAFEGCASLTGVYISDLAAWCNITFEDTKYNFYGGDFSSNPLIYAKRLYLNGNLITNLVIPEGVEEIKDFAFRGCSSLTSVTIPSSVITIGAAAFWDCTGLTGVYISDLAAWCNIDFFLPEYDYNYEWQPNPLKYAKKLYLNGNLITDLVIPEGVEEIKQYTFSGCSSLTSVTIPNGVTKIGLDAFAGCTGLTGVYISDLTAWCNIMFDSDQLYNYEVRHSSGLLNNAKNLYLNGALITDLVIPEGVEEIKDCAFFGYTNLASVKIPNSVTSIGEMVFYECTGLESVKIANGVTSIGEMAFYECTGLESFIIPNSVTSIEQNTFIHCKNLKTVINLSNLSISKGSTGNGFVACYADKVLNYQGGEVIDDFIFAKVNGVSTLALYLGENEEIVLPDNYKGAPYAIGANAFENNTALKSITLPGSVTAIGNYAFSGCTALASIEIPGSVTTIGSYAFSGCSRFTDITIPNSVTTIGSKAFYGCNNLKTVMNFSELAFSKGSTSNGYVAYYADKVYNAPNGEIVDDFVFGIIDNTALLAGYLGEDNEIVLPDNYKGAPYAIGANAFENNTALKSITLPGSVTAIGNYAFSGCTALASIEIPGSVTTIGNYVFSGCTALASIEIPGSVTAIGSYAFSGCTALASIEIPGSVTTIGSYAFSGCSRFTDITIPNSVTTIGSKAFYGCNNLKTVMNFSELAFSKGSTSNGYVAYYADKVYNAPNGEIVDDFVFGIIDNTAVLVGYLGENEEIVLPDNYKGAPYAIGANAFEDYTNLKSVTIPDAVTAIGNYAFSGCTALASIEIPGSVTTIGSYAFSGCSRFTDITIPNSVTTIGSKAFYGCNNLKTVMNFSELAFSKGSTSNGYVAYYADKVYNAPNGEIVDDFVFCVIDNTPTLVICLKVEQEIVLPDNYKGISYAIGDSVFTDYTNLKDVTIPNSVTAIGDYAFKGCSSLTSVTIGDSVTVIGKYVFSDCSSLTGVTIGNSVTTIGNWAFSDCTALTSIEIPNSVMTIETEAFCGCTALVSIEIPGSVTTINECVFEDCISLTNVIIPNSVTSIEYAAFYGCTALTSIEIPNSVKEVGGSVFRNCTNLASVTIGNGVECFGEKVFRDCTNLKSVHINDLSAWCNIDFVDYIDNPLYYAKELYLNGNLITDLVIPDDVTVVKDYTFYNCDKLTKISISNSVTAIGSYAFAACSNVETLYISSSIKEIGSYAFYDCINLLEIYVGAKLAVECDDDLFSSDTYNNACLYVPVGRKFAYERTNPWNKFYITESDFTSVDDVTIEGDKEVYYDLSGRRVENPTNGIYIVNGKKRFIK